MGGWTHLACAAALMACIGPANRARGEDVVNLTQLNDGQFNTVSQPAPGDAPAAGSEQTPQPRTRPRGPSAPQPSAQTRSFGSARGPQSSAPSMIGDFFGAGSLQIFLQPPSSVINTSVAGFGRANSFTDPASQLQFATNQAGPPVLTAGQGMDTTGDGFIDTWTPNAVPPQFIPPPPGPGVVILNNGSVVGFTRGTGIAVDGNPNGGVSSPPGGFLPGFELLLSSTFTPDRLIINAPNPSGGGSVGRVKIAENNSPLPRDRIFHNYSFFNNVPLTSTGVDVNRFVPGFEKTFFGGIASVEMRFPFASTLDSTLFADAAPDTGEVEFGNVGIPLKVLVYQNDQIALSGGLQVTLPTADDTEVLLSNGTPLVRIENESVHLMPFIGLLLTPNDRLFMQAFVQIDADTQGSPVSVTNFAGGLTPVGRLDDVTYMYLDMGVGYWLLRNDNPRGLTGVAPTLEVHVNDGLNSAPVLQSGGLLVTGTNQSLDSTNLVVGTMFEWGQNTTLTVGYAAPLSGEVDRQFDGEVRVLFNHRFGPQTRASRAQF